MLGHGLGFIVVAAGGVTGKHMHDAVSQLTRDGVWLIALGGVLVACGLLAGGHLIGLSGRPVGPVGTRTDRVAYALALLGAVLIAGGGVIAGVQEAPGLGVVLLTVALAAIAFYLLSAWRLRVDMLRVRDQATKNLREGRLVEPALSDERRNRDAADRGTQWGHVLRFALKSDDAGERARRTNHTGVTEQAEPGPGC